MLRLRDIMTTDVVTVTPETNIREAMEILATRHVSGAPVVSGTELVGVVTATDLLSFAAALSGVPTERDIQDGFVEVNDPPIMDDVEIEDEAASAYFAELWDDAGTTVPSRIATTDSPEWNALEEHDVSEVMTRAPLTTLSPLALAEEAAEVMRNQSIHRVLVTEDGRLRGVVSALDIVKAAADRRFTSRTYVFGRA